MSDDKEPLEDEGEDENEADSGDGKAEDSSGSDSDSSSESSDRRGRATKEPPPPKNWRVEAQSPEGIRVTLGRYVTREEAEPEAERIKQDGFYTKVRLVESE